MAKKQSPDLGKKVLNVVLIAIGIYLIVVGVLPSESQNWRAFELTLGLVLQVTGTIGFAKIK
ncbi:MAG: hypothetical protein QG675_188 [Patescibacteria group bacterium]|jgi:multisubunit Na+/H+ antiporter MnhB subunit|nr:hypothetical protein [Patescibacteria group bacterium]